MFRKRSSSWLSYSLFTVVVVCLAVGIASAQTQFEPADTYQVTYYSNAVSGENHVNDATVHIVNPGTSLTKINANGKPLNGNLCAMIYVLNDDQQEEECCSCELTPDSEDTLSVNTDLLSSPINPAIFTKDGVIKIVSAAYNTKNPADFCRPDLPNIVPTAGLRAWVTHIQAQPGPPATATTFPETEEEFASAPLSDFELQNLENQCSAIFTSGSGVGECKCEDNN
jgi:hypothetical protein